MVVVPGLLISLSLSVPQSTTEADASAEVSIQVMTSMLTHTHADTQNEHFVIFSVPTKTKSQSKQDGFLNSLVQQFFNLARIIL